MGSTPPARARRIQGGQTAPAAPQSPPLQSPFESKFTPGKVQRYGLPGKSSLRTHATLKPPCREGIPSAPITENACSFQGRIQGGSCQRRQPGRHPDTQANVFWLNAPLSNFLRVLLGRYCLPIRANRGVQPREEIKNGSHFVLE